MHFIVVGCGRLGATLAYRLSRKGHVVVVLEDNPESFRRLPADFRGRMVEGGELGQAVLRRAGIEHSDGLAAVTDSDPLNAVLGHIARTIFSVPNVVVRNVDPAWLTYHEAFGAQIVSSAGWGAQRIESLLLPSETPTVISIDDGGVRVLRLTVPERWWGRSLASVLARSGVRAVALTRRGGARLAEPDMTLEQGDILSLAGAPEDLDALGSRAAT